MICVLAGVLAALGGGCASDETSTRASTSAPADQLAAGLRTYRAQVEPIRLAGNKLLGTADPIFAAMHDRRITRARAAAEMGALEQRFAAYAVDVNAIAPALPALRSLHAEYAHTYVLEDAYLSALVNGLAEDNLRDLPDTQAAQRAAIIGWRTGLTVLALRAGIALPADLQQAGRGEVAPSPTREVDSATLGGKAGP